MNTITNFFNLFANKAKLSTTINMQQSYIRELESKLENMAKLSDVKALQEKFSNVEELLSKLDCDQVSKLEEKLDSLDLDTITNLSEKANDVDELLYKFQNLDASTLEDIITNYEELGYTFSNEDPQDFTSEFEDINFKLDILYVNERLCKTTSRNEFATQVEDYTTSNFNFLIYTIKTIELENLKHAKEYDMLINILEKKIFAVSFIDRSNNTYLELEFHIDINKQFVKKFVNTENISLLEEINKLKLDQTFEFYLAHKNEFH